ncbi:conserved hypothetical protein [Renibacterium salmoninarum ATCC 33209]|uniref:General stress protein 17M-like domain-containing protein n=1 Tax=Renibacterium salmoninarum (strain ATCC 33209 / DSM 20767 / JCM 11484 / NBRC 15589 / NCIMB 2235) TaxID=288705 RepID=A9WPG0_RENSM|nr:general stress protein [Renibacterium salmoninarum]ABY22935.1 conserved hypothetical protein [Renibacterium salmoninarum ATCC 33209]
MSNLFGNARTLADPRSVPDGDTVGTYTSYLDAQKAVDYLADQQFPVQLVSIVGNDLKMVERVTGKLSYPKVALNGALTGAWFGLFVGVLLSFFNPNASTSFLSIPIAMVLGAAFWMLFGIVTYGAQRGKRDFTSTSQVLASSYDVIVAREASAEAQRLLKNLPMAQTAVLPQAKPREQHLPDASQAPQRPSGWTDPYAAKQDGQAEAAEPAAPVVEGAIETARGKYPDLCDGRPQYGVRVDPEKSKDEPSAG